MKDSEKTANESVMHLIDPRKKDREWILKMIKSYYKRFRDGNYPIFYNNRDRYYTCKLYARGKQSINQYKPIIGVDDDNDTTWMQIAWDIVPIMPKLRRMALNRLSKAEYNINIDAIDPISTKEKHDYFREQESKINIKNRLSDIGSPEAEDLAKLPMLKQNDDDPKTIEELKMREQFSYKHSAAIDMTNILNVVFETNDSETERDQLREDLFDYGVAGVKSWLDSKGKVRFRRVDPANVVTGYSSSPYFKDMKYVGEIRYMTVAELKEEAGNQFTEEEYKTIALNYSGQLGNPEKFNPSPYNQSHYSYRIKVWDVEFKSVNTTIWESGADKNGNKVTNKTNFNNLTKVASTDKYKRTDYEVVYKSCWVISTEYMYNYGMQSDIVRLKETLDQAETSYILTAYDFYKMNALGLVEQSMSMLDQIQLDFYKLQNIKAQARPKGIQIEIGALSELPIGQGGSELQPLEVVDLYNQTGVLLYRKDGIDGNATNWRPIDELENGIAKDAMFYFDSINRQVMFLKELMGLNDFTDGSTPDSRTLTTVAKAAIQSTNNALHGVIKSERQLLNKLSKHLICRLQDTIKNKSQAVRDYTEAVGAVTVKTVKDLYTYDFGVEINNAPDEFERQNLETLVAHAIKTNQISIADAVAVGNVTNPKEAEMLLAYRSKLYLEEQTKSSIALQNANTQSQIQSSAMSQQLKDKSMALEYNLKAELEKLKQTSETQRNHENNVYKLLLQQLENKGDIDKTLMQHYISLGGNMADIEKLSGGDTGMQPPESVAGSVADIEKLGGGDAGMQPPESVAGQGFPGGQGQPIPHGVNQIPQQSI